MRLIIEDDSGRRTVVPFTEDRISIGRERGNTVRLDDRNVSRRHALLAREEGRLILEDLDSSNGVRINGDRIRGKLEVREGDIIGIGDYALALEDETKASLPERPTQPELGANPVAPDDLGDELAALARMHTAAALHATLTKEKPRAAERDPERDTDPKRNAVDAEAAWPPDFHRFEPEAMRAARVKAERRRMLRVAIPVVLVVAAVALMLRSRAMPPRAEPPTVVAAPTAPVVAPVIAPVAAPAAAPTPEAARPVVPPTAAPPLVAVQPSAPAPRPAVRPAVPAPRATTRGKAHDLYQDAVADVGNGDYPAAMSKLQEALRIDPASPEAHKELAICYSHLNQPDKGVLHYQRYLELAPQAADADDVRKMLRDYRAAKGQ